MTKLNRLSRLAVTAAIAVGTLGATVAATVPTATPALADAWHHDGAWRDRDGHWHDRGWRDRFGRWHAYPYYGPQRGYRWFDRQHGYWRDNLGYWNPHSGLYISFRF
jgi:hypothetical protein